MEHITQAQVGINSIQNKRNSETLTKDFCSIADETPILFLDTWYMYVTFSAFHGYQLEYNGSQGANGTC